MSSKKKIIPLQWPSGGVNKRYAVQTQPPYTAVSGRNVRTYSQGRYRGDSRPGLERVFTASLLSELSRNTGFQTLTSVTYIAAGEQVVTQIIGVAGGNLFYQTGDSSTTGNSLTAINPDPLIQATEFDQKLYIADHHDSTFQSDISYFPKVWDPANEALSRWQADSGKGTIPLGCSCICTYRGRLLLAGGTTNPYGLFGSRQNDPYDWDFSKVDASAAFSVGEGTAGTLADKTSCLAPHGDQCVIVGCPTTMWLMIGDPQSGGGLENLSQTVGIVDTMAWCHLPDGSFLFLSQDGLYLLPPGCGVNTPQPISRSKLPEELLNIEPLTGSAGTAVSMAYDSRHRGVLIGLSERPVDNDDPSGTHWWFDLDSQAFWEVTFAEARFEPFVQLGRKNFTDGQSPVLMGCRDGYLRRFTTENDADDDGETTEKPIASHITLGPFTDALLYEDMRLDECLFVLSSDTEADVTWEIFRGDTAEEAADAADSGTASASGTLSAGRSFRCHPRVRGPALYVKLSATSGTWAYEAAQVLLAKAGKTRV